MNHPVSNQDPDAEMDALLDGVYRKYHYDFRNYARPFLRRRVAQARASLGMATVGDLTDRVLGEPDTFAGLLRYFTVNVSYLFRDPEYYRSLRAKVVSHLATYPSLRIWVAGCGEGEEAYSLAILMQEEGLLDRSFIYATDIDTARLRIAGIGTYKADRIRQFSASYVRAGGRGSLSDYYTATGSHLVFDPALRERILFSEHCLATDAAFAEVQLVSCRNVLIYFDRDLQDRAIDLFRASLCPRGFLGLGIGETLMLSGHATAFEPVAEPERVYRMR